MRKYYILSFLFFIVFKGKAQCTIYVVKDSICNLEIQDYTLNGSQVLLSDSIIWTFDNVRTKGKQVKYAFSVPGLKKIKAVAYKQGSISCSDSTIIYVKPGPLAQYKFLSDSVQCFERNRFCFEDLSVPPPGGTIVKSIWFFGDGGADSSGNINTCYEYKVDNKVHDVILIVVDNNGCEHARAVKSQTVTRKAVGAAIAPVADTTCGAVTLKLTNISATSVQDIAKFWWIFGDSTAVDSVNLNPVHYYEKSGRTNARLIINRTDGCSDTGISNQFYIFNPKDALLVAGGSDIVTYKESTTKGVSFIVDIDNDALTNGNINFGDINSGPQNYVNYKMSYYTHVFSDIGMYNVVFTGIRGNCKIPISKKVFIAGPKALIEQKPLTYIPDSVRYQCTIKDTVFFTNVSSFFLNDDNPADDTLTTLKRFGTNTVRLWDFGDQYALSCTTDTKNGINVTSNCNFSVDSLPKHWYTPGKEKCYTATLFITDTVRNITSVSTANMVFGKPDAGKLEFKPSGSPCYGSAVLYGMRFEWNKDMACDQQRVWFHLDSIYDRNDATPNDFDNWLPQEKLFTGQNYFPSWPMASLGLPPYPKNIWHHYNITSGNYPYSLSDPEGKVTIGFRIINGRDHKTGQDCVDERWYHHPFRYNNSQVRFSLDKQEGCVKDTFELKFEDLNVSNLNSVTIDLGSGQDFINITDSFTRNKIVSPDTAVNYIIRHLRRERGDLSNRYPYYEVFTRDSIVTRIFNPQTGITSFFDYRDTGIEKIRKIVPDHFGRYTVTSYVSGPCSRSQFTKVILVGHLTAVSNASDYFNTLGEFAYVGDTVIFRDSLRYYLLIPAPRTLDDYDYWADPTGGETIYWDFGQGFNTSGVKPKAVFDSPGLKQIRVASLDRTGCRDTSTFYFPVNKLIPGFKHNINAENCVPLARFADQSYIIDSWDSLSYYTKKIDSITQWHWNFGDNSNDSTSVLQHPVHLYKTPGDYIVKLRVTTSKGYFKDIASKITIKGFNPSFTIAKNNICEGEEICLKNTSKGGSGNAAWVVLFGDGNGISTSSMQDICYTYDKDGEYTVSMFMFDSLPYPGGKNCGVLYPDIPLHTPVSMKVLNSPEAPAILGNFNPSANATESYSATGDKSSIFIWNVQGGSIVIPSQKDTISVLWNNSTQAHISVREKAVNGCYSDTVVENINITLGISLAGNYKNIKIYPNPSKDVLFVESKDQITGGILMDIQGREFPVEIASGNNIFIDISRLSSGNYLLKLRTSSEDIVVKFVKE